mgnify:CR=1 FL=1|jgi:uncharacterized protein YpbB
MNFKKVILTNFCFICLTFSSHNLMGQTLHKIGVDKKIEKKESNIILQKKKNNFKKLKKENPLKKINQ